MSAMSSLVTTTKTTPVAVPDWHNGVPANYIGDPNYFRNHDISKYALYVAKAKSSLSQHDVQLTTKEAILALENSKDKNRGPAPLCITFPPCRVMYPNLHASGDYPAVDGKKLTDAKYSLRIVEGNIPEDLIEKFPAIERENIAAFDFVQQIYDKVIDLFWEHPDLRDAEKTSARTLLTKITKGSMTPDEFEAELKSQFYHGANQFPTGGKVPLVRPADGAIKGRNIAISKSVSSKIDTSAKKQPKMVPRQPDPNHYVNKLLDAGQYIKPPTIIYKNKETGRREVFDLGANEEQFLFNGDIVAPTFFIKAFDAGSYGCRAMYNCLTIVRRVLESEKSQAGADLTLYEDEDVQILPSKKRKADASASPAKKSKQGEDDASGSGNEFEQPIDEEAYD